MSSHLFRWSCLKSEWEKEDILYPFSRVFEEILRDTNDDVEQVNVALDGTWSLVKQKDIFDVGASYMGEASEIPD